MGIFQQQFNSILSTAMSTRVSRSIQKVANELPEAPIKANDFKTIAADLEKNPEAQEVHAALNRLSAQALQDKVMKEEIAGQQTEQSIPQVINNRAKAKRTPLTDKQFEKEFYKRAKPIVHGGNE